ncbi:hypothetical protein TNCT_465011 [Trichonephila clavata]|uniref:Uncharacterized protein n=1 Tax=Trichonephila clavata TaxID=2740835 RepID=A0A8X6GK60_TRICU|nr:hypothetical protein TNCT_465011 [Trichonephila clavata]
MGDRTQALIEGPYNSYGYDRRKDKRHTFEISQQQKTDSRKGNTTVGATRYEGRFERMPTGMQHPSDKVSNAAESGSVRPFPLIYKAVTQG